MVVLPKCKRTLRAHLIPWLIFVLRTIKSYQLSIKEKFCMSQQNSIQEKFLSLIINKITRIGCRSQQQDNNFHKYARNSYVIHFEIPKHHLYYTRISSHATTLCKGSLSFESFPMQCLEFAQNMAFHQWKQSAKWIKYKEVDGGRNWGLVVSTTKSK